MSFYSFDFISEVAQANGRDLAYIDESRKVTFSEFEIGTRKIAGYLRGIGVKENDIVATILPTYFSWFFTFALHRMGVGVISKNTYSNFAPEALPDFLISFKYHANFPKEKTIIVDPDLMRKVEQTEADMYLSGYSDPHAPARFFSTSGTTGGTRYISYEAEKLEMLASRKSAYDVVGLDHVLTLYPFGSGQNYRLALKHLISGRTHYSLDVGGAKSIEFMRENPIRTLSASPTQVATFLDSQKKTGTILPNLSTIIMGGSPPSEQLVQRIKSQLDCRIFNSYGSTEAGNIGFIEITDGVEKTPGFDIIHEDIALDIVDDQDNLLPVASVGHIRYRRSDMATSYYKNPVATAQFFKGGYFYPGDLGFIDEEGRLVLEGRSTEIINLGGVKVNPERIETIALAQLGVRDCAAFGRINDAGVEELWLALVVDADFSQENFDKAMASKSPHKIRHSRAVEAIPRNENGKIQRNLLATE
jgi:acyl-coenzyme A synthetase/AMP-(fatty) acid ligase